MAAAAACFGEYSVEVSGTSSEYLSSKTAGTGAAAAAAAAATMSQSSVSCLYRTKLAGQCRVVTVTWSKSVIGHSLAVCVDDGKIGCKVEIRPWLFWKRHGSKSFHLHEDHYVELFWDLSSAKFSQGPQPVANFLLALVCDNEIFLELGDRDRSSSKTKLGKDALKRLRAAKPASIQAALLSRREHLYGKKFFTTKASFCEGGDLHEVIIECPTLGSYRGDVEGGEFQGRAGNSTSGSGSSTGLSSGSSSSSGHSSSSSRSSGGKLASSGWKEPRLCIRIDRKVVLQVKRLAWKFRGNQTIVIDGQQVEVFWDVHNWLFSGGAAAPPNAAVFMFQMPDQSKPLQQRDASSTGFSLFLYACRSE